MKKIIGLIFIAFLLGSCRQIDSGTVTITNTLASPVRVHLSQNYEAEIITIPATSSVSRRFEVYHSVYPEDKIPRCTFSQSGDDYSIIPILAKTSSLYVSNTYGSNVVLLNGFETDTLEYTVLSGASDQVVSMQYFEKIVLALKTIPADDYVIEQKVEYGKNYVLIRPSGY